MPWRGRAPIQLVIVIVGSVALVTAAGMVIITVVAAVRGADVGDAIPTPLANVCIAALSGLIGLLAPSTGLMTTGRADHLATRAGQAAAAAVVEHEGLHDLQAEAEELRKDEGT